MAGCWNAVCTVRSPALICQTGRLPVSAKSILNIGTGSICYAHKSIHKSSQLCFCTDDARAQRADACQLTIEENYLRAFVASAVIVAAWRGAPVSVRRCSASHPWYKASAEVQALRGYHTGVGQCALSVARSHRASVTSATPPNSEHILQRGPQTAT